MRILGVDPGTLKMGYGLLDEQDGCLSLVSCGVLTASQKSPLPERLHLIYNQLLQVLLDNKPAIMAVEEPFVARNPRTAMAVGQAQGIAFLAAAHFGLQVCTYPPRLVKQAVSSYGGSSKEQVQEMVRVHLNMDALPEPTDAADALAVAICHSRHAQEHDLISRNTES